MVDVLEMRTAEGVMMSLCFVSHHWTRKDWGAGAGWLLLGPGGWLALINAGVLGT